MALSFYNFKPITKLTSELGVNSSPISVEALEVPLSTGDIINIVGINNTIYRTEVISNVAVGATSIPINVKTTEALGIHNKTPIAEGSAVMIEDNEMMKYVKRDSHMYINFSSKAAASQYWTTFSSSGISNHSWNTVTTDSSNTLNDISTQIQSVGIVIPFDCTLVGMMCIFYRVGNHQSSAALFWGTPNYNDDLELDMSNVCNVDADNSAGPDSNYSQRPVKGQNLSASFPLSAGDILLPAFKGTTTGGGNLRVSYTVILESNKL
tara:strand:+ start:4211 stop:5008 length:798 start_codon:yes stop_codon:yes gene_type:complete